MINKYLIYKTIIILIILCSFDLTPTFPYKISSENINKLKNGEIIIKKYKYTKNSNQVARLAGIILINRNIDVVWKTLLDWEKMSVFVNGLDYYKIIKKVSSEKLIIEGQIHVTLVKLRYSLFVHIKNNKYYQCWRLLNNEDIKKYNVENKVKPTSKGIKNIEGFQYCIPLDNNSTIVYYSPVVTISIPVPGFIENTLTNKSIKDYLIGLKDYIENNYK